MSRAFANVLHRSETCAAGAGFVRRSRVRTLKSRIDIDD
ncbi:hypothetical protein BURCENBC7_AP6577 [Burkholderia cenocepacia BC7]|nr:hypothetical protein BURCENBC7_AP6577 [Burkholderia cenocepacia BC7]